MATIAPRATANNATLSCVGQVKFLFENRNMTCPNTESQAISKKDRVGCRSRKSNGRWIELPLDRKAEISRFGVGS
jgi:hypothetical protein